MTQCCPAQIIFFLASISVYDGWVRSTEIDYASSTTTVTHRLPSLNASASMRKSPVNEIPIPRALNQSTFSAGDITYAENFKPSDLLKTAGMHRKDRVDNETDSWTQVTSIYSLIMTEHSPFGVLLAPKMEKRQMMPMMNMSMMMMMKMMKKTNKMNMMMNMMNSMMKFKSK